MKNLTAEQIIADIDARVEKPFVTAQFGGHWKQHAKDNYDLDSVIEIAYKQGRRAILLERAVRELASNAFTKEDLKKAYNNGSRQGSTNGMRVARGGEMNVKTFDEWYDEHYR